MIKLVTSFFLIIFLVSCKIQQTNQILDILPEIENHLIEKTYLSVDLKN